jgi:hypothetical protein
MGPGVYFAVTEELVLSPMRAGCIYKSIGNWQIRRAVAQQRRGKVPRKTGEAGLPHQRETPGTVLGVT